MCHAPIGYDPDTILAKLRKLVEHRGQANGFVKENPHGLENCSILPNTLHEMLCMSHQHVLRLFPVWPKGKDARFAGLRAWGAFVVSSELKDGTVSHVRIHSERGRPCTVENPWPQRPVAVTRAERRAETVSGARFTLATQVNELITLTPAGGGASASEQPVP